MFVEVLFWVLSILTGVVIGIISGLVPGIHVNTTSLLLFIALQDYLNENTRIYISLTLLSSAITHSFLDFIPSVFVGAPDSESALSTSLGHKYFMRGLGKKAITLTTYGGFLGTLLLVLSLPLLLLSKSFLKIPKFLVVVFLIGASLFLILRQKNKSKALIVALFSGILGLLVLNSPINKTRFLFPLFSGLFGVSTLFLSTYGKVQKVKERKYKIKKEDVLKGSFFGFLGGILANLVPSLGATASGAIITKGTGTKNRDVFLTTIGTINTVDALLSVIMLYLIGNGRSGVAIIIGNIVDLNLSLIFLFSFSAVVIALLNIPLTLKISSLFLRILKRANIKLVNVSVILFVLLLSLITTGFLGVILLATSTFLGVYAQTNNVDKTTLTFLLILPTILFYI